MADNLQYAGILLCEYISVEQSYCKPRSSIINAVVCRRLIATAVVYAYKLMAARRYIATYSR